jgi:hypothetical protein
VGVLVEGVEGVLVDVGLAVIEGARVALAVAVPV